MFFKFVDQTAPKNEIRDALLEIAAGNGEQLSKARADKLANKFKQGRFDPDLVRILAYADPTGEEAVAHVMAERKAHEQALERSGKDLVGARVRA